MQRLNQASLATLPANITAPKYAPVTVSSGILHFGVGNFHRAHQAMYCDALLNKGELKWGITGISMRSPDMRDHLAAQDYLYTQATLGEQTQYQVVGALQHILVAPEDPQAVISEVANSNIQLITMTITEKGYDLANDELNVTASGVAHDLLDLSQPKTIYGYIAAGLIQRCTKQGSKLTVLCCDNMHAGGEVVKAGVMVLLNQHSPETIAWIDENVAFASSMVDRVTPATSEQLKHDVTQALGLVDAAPVAAEPFTQWIIEDNFAGERPPFDRVGALFVDDITPFEKVKLRFLNASHSMLAAMGYLAGDQFIHEALRRSVLAQFAEQALKLNVLPVTHVPQGMSGVTYIDEVLARFRNHHLPYAVLQVGTDSSQKIQQRWFPAIDDALRVGGASAYLAFAVAAWASFIRKALENNDLNDPLSEALAQSSEITNTDTTDFATRMHGYLRLAGAESFDFYSNRAFMDRVTQCHIRIERLGVEQALSVDEALSVD